MPAQGLPSEKGDNSVSRTDADAASDPSPKNLNQHKYGSNEEGEEELEQAVESGASNKNNKDEAGGADLTHMTTDTPELLTLSQPPSPLSNDQHLQKPVQKRSHKTSANVQTYQLHVVDSDNNEQLIYAGSATGSSQG